MPFWDDLGDGIMSFSNSVQHFVEPVVNRVVEVGSNVGSRVLDRLDSYTQLPLTVTDSFTNLLKSPIILIGALVLGGIVITRVIPSK